jgi:hypothetical protein
LLGACVGFQLRRYSDPKSIWQNRKAETSNCLGRERGLLIDTH